MKDKRLKSLARLLFILSSVLFSMTEYTMVGQDNNAIFRGKYPNLYNFRYNGTYYWNPDGFYKADIMYNGIVYKNVNTNIDACSQNVIVMPDSSSLPVMLYRDQVSWVQNEKTLYVNLNYLGYKDAPEGFFEVLKDDMTPVLLQVKKVIENVTGNRNGGSIGYVDPDYKTDVITAFSKKVAYYQIKSGKVEKISKRKAARESSKTGGSDKTLYPLLDEWHAEASAKGTLSELKLPKSGIGLPEGFFSDKKENGEAVISGNTDNQTATYRNKVYTVGENIPGKSKAKVSGIITDRETGEPLWGTTVYNDKTDSYTRSDKRGRYVIELPVGENKLHFIHEGKEDTELMVNILSDGSLNVDLPERVTYIKEAVISASSMENHRRTQMGIESVSMTTMNKIPSAFGEGDILRAVLTLPGVKSVGEASGGFNVRGGSADENLILFNENTIYNPSHLFGIFSAFNPDVVENVDMYKSSMPVEYGGRLSSVMKVTMKDGEQERAKGSVGLGILTGRLHVEGPVISDKTTFIAAARTTYSDWLLKRLPTSSTYSGAEAAFYDINTGITHRFNQKTSLKLSFYHAKDNFALSDKAENSYGNTNASAILSHKDREGLSWQISTGYDHYSNLTGDHTWAEGAYNLTTVIDQGFLKTWWKKAFGSNTVTWGINGLYYALNPGMIEPYGDDSVISAQHMAVEKAIEGAAFVSDEWTLSDKLSIDGGLRLTGFTSLWDSKKYWNPEFRLSAKCSPEETLSFKAGFQTMTQYIHLISNTTGISPLDTWKLSDVNIEPTTGYQVACGVYWTHIGTGLDFSAELYYKGTRNAFDYKNGAKLSMNEELYKDIVKVSGRSYGVELMVKKPAGKLTGWASYSYSRAQFKEMEDHGANTIAGGNWDNTPFDKPHEFKLVTNWAITHRYSLSANVDYSTGRPYTPPIGMYYYKGSSRIAYAERNSDRIPDYFRVDAALNIDPGFYLKALAHMSFTVGVYNVLGRKNPYSVYFDAHTGGLMSAYMISVFATQVPYININITF